MAFLTPLFRYLQAPPIVRLQNGNIAEDLGQLRDPVGDTLPQGVPLVRIFEAPDHAADQFFQRDDVSFVEGRL